MKITENPNELVVQETPGCLWIFASLFLFVGGVFVYGSLGGFVNRDGAPQWMFVVSFLMGATACAVGAWVIFSAPVTKVAINRLTKTVTLTRWGLTGKRRDVYDFDRVKRFCVVEAKDTEGDSVWSFGMELTDGEMMEISSLASPREKYKRDFVLQTNRFMRKQMPLYQNVLEAEDESERKIG